MKESVGYTVTLNIMIVFITIIVAFLCAALIYFKSNKVSNVITETVEKYEGFNSLAINEINTKLSSIGYGSRNITCANTTADKGAKGNSCNIQIINVGGINYGNGQSGYCVYLCEDLSADYYYYKIRTNMMITIPIINDLLDIPIYSNTNRLYDFEK